MKEDSGQRLVIFLAVLACISAVLLSHVCLSKQIVNVHLAVSMLEDRGDEKATLWMTPSIGEEWGAAGAVNAIP